jgi:GR25 family glycosyltransferase involved in LPS biosynthesis
MIWTKFFDGIYLINLPQRTERFMTAAEELERYDIPFETVHAKWTEVPGEAYKALWITVAQLLMKCRDQKKQRVLVFEDDVQFVENPNNYMPAVIRQLDGYFWDMLSLGPNTHQPLEKVSHNLLRMQKCRGLHATAYNKHVMEFLTCFPTPETSADLIELGSHLDQFFEEKVQTRNFSFCTYPMLATQRNGKSDISDETDKTYIEKRFRANTLHLETN